jgi:hypothetical protein
MVQSLPTALTAVNFAARRSGYRRLIGTMHGCFS